MKKEAILAILKDYLGETPDENGIELLEKISDAADEDETESDKVDWEQKFKENDAAWRKKYADRFFNPPESTEDHVKETIDGKEPEQPETKVSYNDLFNEKEG